MNPRLPLLLATALSGSFPIVAAQEPPVAPAENNQPTAPEKPRSEKTAPEKSDTEKDPPKKDTPEKSTPEKAVSPERAAMYRYLAKSSGKPVGQRSRAATRNGDVVPVKLVALAPAEPALTLLGKPRIWWWQSHDTRPGELEFTITRMDARPRTVFETRVGPLKAGYNAIDLSQATINPGQFALDPGVDYLWTLGCFNGLKKSSVFVSIRRANDEALAAKFAKEPSAADTVNALAAAGNWYELFDTVALPARLKPENHDFATIRQSLLEQVGLKDETKPE